MGGSSIGKCPPKVDFAPPRINILPPPPRTTPLVAEALMLSLVSVRLSVRPSVSVRIVRTEMNRTRKLLGIM